MEKNYKVGDEVWVMDENNIPAKIQIEDIIYDGIIPILYISGDPSERYQAKECFDNKKELLKWFLDQENTIGKVNKEQVINDLKSLFDVSSFSDEQPEKSFEIDGKFFIHKNKNTRCEVIATLEEYFSDKVVLGGKCSLEPITLLWTVFTIE